MKTPHPKIELSYLQKEALTGSMLGDGHLALNGVSINAKLMIGRSLKDKEYLEYEMAIFENLIAPRFKNGVQITNYFNKRDKKTNPGCNFATINNSSLTEFHNIWYKDKRKQIPNDLCLSNISIAHWIADDGNISYNKLPYRFVTEISTHSFSEDEVNFIAKLLSERYNERFLVRQKNRNDKKFFIIKIYDSACRVLFSDIDEHFKMTRKRIWDKPESRFYEDIPDRQISTIDSFNNRKQLVNLIIQNKNDITMFDLANQLGYYYNNRIAYDSVNLLLEPYLKSGIIIKEIDRLNNNAVTIKVIK